MQRKGFRSIAAALACITSIAAAYVVIPGAGAHRGFSPASIKGRWGFFTEYERANRYGTSVGIVRFDGRGNCTVQGIENGGDAPQGTTYEGSCSYTLGRRGRGQLASDELPDLAFHLSEHGRAIVFILAERGDLGWGEMRPMGRGPFDASIMAGRWSEIHPARFAEMGDMTVGFIRFDGVDECRMRYVENGPFTTPATVHKLGCSYEIAPTGWGTINGSDHLVVTNGGQRAYYMHGQPGNVGWGEFTRL